MMTRVLLQAISAISAALPPAGNHLWQSTLFAAAIGVLAVALRRNRAEVRHRLWLAASLKFLVPFAWLSAVGSRFAPRSASTVTQQGMTIVIEALSRPFPQTVLAAAGTVPPAVAHVQLAAILPVALFAIWLGGFALVAGTWWGRWCRVAAAARAGRPIETGREVDTLRSLEAMTGLKSPMSLVASTASIEPGVFGIAEPVLLWPQYISEELTDDQLETILAHEVSHVRRRDNLAAAVHMLVEALFWFHPLVWWVGARLVDERERACDEAVLLTGGDPEAYAEGILKACRLSMESPLACMAGVTGSDLQKRIERIMKNRAGEALTVGRRLLLTAALVFALAGPVTTGLLSERRLRAESRSTGTLATPSAGQNGPEFEVASVKPNKTGDGRVAIAIQPGGRFTATNVPLRMLIRNAYQLQDSQISGGPGWLASDRFDVVAKAEGDLGDPFQSDQRNEPSRLQLMLRALLADRFKLVAHNESREMPIYALVLARNDGRLGPKLQRSTVDCAALMAGARGRGAMPPGPPPPGERPQCGMRMRPGNLSGGGSPLSQFASTLSMFAGRIVLDRTGLTGTFDIDLSWTPDQMPQRPPGAADAPLINGAPIDPNGPSLFTAVQEQLGLKLDSQKSPVGVLVIDHVEPPTPD